MPAERIQQDIASDNDATKATDPDSVAELSRTTDTSEEQVEVKVVANEPTSIQQQQRTVIQLGNHSNIPTPDRRIGPNGEKNYVHDPKWLLGNPRPFKLPPDEAQELCYAPGNGTEGVNGLPDVLNIRNHIEASKASRDVKLFCAVYTYSGGVKWTNAISETWGQKCDGLLFSSDNHSNETGHMLLKSNSWRGFSYKGMIQRLRTMMAYIYDNFLDDYDFFHFCGDDVFIMVENLKEFLASDKVRQWDEVPDQYLFAGFWMKVQRGKPGDFYLGGGSGYTLSRKALKAYVEGPLQTCQTTKEGAAEDLFFTQCARNLTDKFIYTADSSGAHRYHQSPAWNHFYGVHVRQSLVAMQQPPISIPQHFGKHEYTSNSSVTFHRHYRPLELRRLELLLYKDLDQECKEIFPLETHVKSIASTGLNFPIGFPQNLTFGRFHKAEASDLERGRPFITQDCWADMVDNRRTFLLRPVEAGMPSMERLQNWIRSRPHPITLVINNQHDLSWPNDLSNKTNYELIMNETNLHAVYAGNARLLEDYPKLHPLPIGIKWNWRSTKLFSENKVQLTALYANNTSTTPEEVEALFRSKGRTPTVYYRHMMNSNRRTRKYIRDTPALQAVRHTIYPILNSTAKTSLRVPGKLELPEYYLELKKHRFLISPPGNGLDTHSTWEALLAGCIPILPKSALDPIFEDLPVWLVENWEDVTDENVNKKVEELTAPDKKYKWEKLFVHYWEQEIYRGLSG